MGIKVKKSLGQNFLTDKNIIKSIVNVGNVKKNNVVLEIGPGTGNLTEYILKKKPKKIFVIEFLLTPMVLSMAISFVLFLTKIVNPEIILKAATIMISVKIINMTFLSTFKAPKKDLFKSAHE